MKYSKSEFLEILDHIEKITNFIYYPKTPHKKMEKKLQKIRNTVKKDGIESILSSDKARL